MKKIDTINSTTFYGNEVSDYAKEKGYVDYKTFSDCFSFVENNTIIDELYRKNIFVDVISSPAYDENGDEYEDEDYDIFRYFIVSDFGAELIEKYTNDYVFYCEELDLYVWGVRLFGTSWDYALTNIKLD